MTQQLEGWELAKLDKWCQMCGAAPGESCTVISGDPEAGEKPGDPRPHPHFYRSSDTKPGVLVPDEPAFAEPAQPYPKGGLPHGEHPYDYGYGPWNPSFGAADRVELLTEPARVDVSPAIDSHEFGMQSRGEWPLAQPEEEPKHG